MENSTITRMSFILEYTIQRMTPRFNNLSATPTDYANVPSFASYVNYQRILPLD